MCGEPTTVRAHAFNDAIEDSLVRIAAHALATAAINAYAVMRPSEIQLPRADQRKLIAANLGLRVPEV